MENGTEKKHIYVNRDSDFENIRDYIEIEGVENNVQKDTCG